jgi:hypothetical protein
MTLDGSESQQAMNCQDLCRSAFSDLFRPVLEKEFPEVLTQLSVGVVGGGSDCLGADDELSRDHDWGVGRCRFLLPERIVKERGEAIEEALAATVPDTYLGIAKDILRPHAIKVTTIDEVYLNLCSMTHPPSTMRGWAGADERTLAMATYGLVIFDPTGELSARKRAFETAYYPEDIRRWQMARVLRQIWQFADYNGIERLGRRGDGVGLLIGQGQFVELVMGFVCMLNKRFSLYWKWLHWQFAQLPKWSDVFEPQLQELEGASGHIQRSQLMRAICHSVREALYAEGLLPDTKRRERMGAFDLMRTIESSEARDLVRELDPTLVRDL